MGRGKRRTGLLHDRSNVRGFRGDVYRAFTDNDRKPRNPGPEPYGDSNGNHDMHGNRDVHNDMHSHVHADNNTLYHRDNDAYVYDDGNANAHIYMHDHADLYSDRFPDMHINRDCCACIGACREPCRGKSGHIQ